MKPVAGHPKASIPASLAYTLTVTPVVSRLVLLVLAGLLVLALMVLLNGPLRLLEERLGTLYWQLFPDTTPEERVVIVAIDEHSLQEIGPWPWSRETLARLSDALGDAGAAAQIYDLVLPEARPGDAELAAALQKHNAIIGQIPLLDQSHTAGVPVSSVDKSQLALLQSGCARVAQASGFLANTTAFSRLQAGHLTPQVDSDGMVRFQSPLICYDNHLYPSLALTALSQQLGFSQWRWLTGAEQAQEPAASLLAPPLLLTADDYPLIRLPLNDEAAMRISYRKSPQSFYYISAADLLQGRVDRRLLQNRWVLVGATAFGLGDLVPTPFSGLTPGVELQARILTDILDQQIPYTPAHDRLISVLLALAQGGLLLLLAGAVSLHHHRLARLLLLSAPVTLPAAMLLLHQVALAYGIWLGWLPQALFGATAALALITLEYLRNRLERQRLYDNLRSYLPESFASEIAFHQPSDQVQARERRFIVLNADLRNFSAYQQQRPAEETALLLHSFFTLATDVIGQHQGVVYELRGDALLAVWPLAQDAGQADQQDRQQAESAMQAARQLLNQMQPLLDHPLPEPLEPLGLGIGLAAGRVTEGTLGAAGRRTQMLLGETVTLAIRLQSMSDELAVPIICDQSLTPLLQKESLQDLGRYLPEGLTAPRHLYTPHPEHHKITRLQDYRKHA